MVHLDLQPEIEAQLVAEAHEKGLAIEAIVTERLLDISLDRGLEDIAAGRTPPAREFFAEFSLKHGVPN